MVTLKDVAASAGVSLATASRVVNGKGSVTRASKEKVEKAIAELGYFSNEVARGLRQDYLNLIAVTLPSIGNPFFSEMLQGIDDVISTEGYCVLFNNTTGDEAVQKQSLRNIRSYGIAGSIVYHLGSLDESLVQLCDAGFYCNIVSAVPQENVRKVEFFHYDVAKIIQMAIQHVIQVGAEEIWLFAPLSDSTLYIQEETIASLPCQLHIVFANESTRDAYKLCEQHAISGTNTACITVNDLLAQGIINYQNERAVRFPIISVGNSSVAKNSLPPISSVGPSGYQIGVSIARNLLSKIENTASQLPVLQLLTPTLVTRN